MNSAENIFGNRTLIRPEFQSIIQNITVHNLEDEANTQLVTFVLLAIITSIVLCYFIQHHFPWFPTVYIFLWVGFLVQMMLVHIYPHHQWKPPELLHSSYFHILQYGIVPFQMFRFGFEINRSIVASNLKSVLVISIGENLLSIFLFSFLWYTLLPMLGLPSFSIWNTLAFCASMIASDSSVTVAFFKERKCSQELTTLMEVDTIFSEIMGLLLFRTIIELQLGEFNRKMVLDGIRYFLSFVFNTCFIGIITGVGSSVLFRFIHLKSPSLQHGEVILFIIVPIMAYMWAQGTHVSSSIAVRICGVFMAKYTQFNLNSSTYPFVANIFRFLHYTRSFIHTFVHLLGQIADCGAYMIFGMLSYIYNFASIDIRWLLLALCVSFLSRYTAIASIFDRIYSSPKQSFLTNHKQSVLLYFLCQGTVAFSIILRTQGELLDTSNTDIMLRIVLFMIHFSVIQIIIIANPLTRGKNASNTNVEVSNDDEERAKQVPNDLFPYTVTIDDSKK